MMDESFDVAALGRIVNLGQLYDAREERFMGTLFKKKLPNEAVQRTDITFSDIEYVMSNTFEEKFEKLNIEAGVKLSALCGLITLTGSAELLLDEENSVRSVKVSVAKKIQTKKEQIFMRWPMVKKIVNKNTLQYIEATHVVVGIKWGGNLFITVEDTNKDNRDEQVARGNLRGMIEKIVSRKLGDLSIHGNVDANKTAKDDGTKFHFIMHGDVTSDRPPQKLAEIATAIKSASKQLIKMNGGKGMPLSYTLYPLSLVRSHLNLTTAVNSVYKELDELTINSCVKLLDDITSDQQEIKDLKVDYGKFVRYITADKSEKLRSFIQNYSEYEKHIKRNLSRLIISIRSGQESINELNNLLKQAYENELSPANINFEQFSSIKEEFAFFNHLNDLGTDIVILNINTTFMNLMKEHEDENIYAYFYSSDYPNLSEEPWIEFKNMLQNRETFDTNTVFVAININVLQENEKKIYFDFDGPSILRLYYNQIRIMMDTTSKAFFIRRKMVNFTDAIAHCADKGWQLASIESENETRAVDNLIHLSGMRDSKFWISGTTFLGFGAHWFWLLSGKPFNYTNWHQFSSVNSMEEDCIELFRDELSGTHYWNDTYCSSKNYCICQKVLF